MNVHQTARFQVQEKELPGCIAAIEEFVAYVRTSEPDTLLYISLQQKNERTRFVHYFIFKDEAARELHASSDAVERFTNILYPCLVEPVEFSDYLLLASTRPNP